MRTGSRRTITALFIAVILSGLFAVSCKKKSGASTSPTVTDLVTVPSNAYDILRFITALATADFTNTAGTASISAGPNACTGPVATVAGNSSVINGGSILVTLHGASSFQILYVTLSNVSGGAGGHYRLNLNSATTDIVLVLTFGTSLPVSSFTMNFGLAASADCPGAYAPLAVTVLPAGTGEIQVSASWDVASDVDLHVVEPSGTEIYWGAPTSTTGGALDLDSNADCVIDNKNNENIRWPVGQAPAGTYTVRIDYYKNCSVAQTNWVVTVQNRGSVSLFRGTLTGSGDLGNVGSGETVTTFTRSGTSSVDVNRFGILPAAFPPFTPSPGKVRQRDRRP